MFNYAIMNLQARWGVNSSWTLFLDRDGVINIEKHLDYIRSVDEFHFYPHIQQEFHRLNKAFGKIIVVTNQRGIGKGLMTNADLHAIHQHLNNRLREYGGHIDAFYYAPELDNQSPNRKPNTGMALQAKQQFPEINFEQSIMVGNNRSDMEFGKRMHMKTVYVETTHPLVESHEWVDVKLHDLHAFIELVG